MQVLRSTLFTLHLVSTHMSIRDFVGGVGFGLDAGGEAGTGDHADDLGDHAAGRTVVTDVQMDFKIIKQIAQARTQFVDDTLGELQRIERLFEHAVVMIVGWNANQPLVKIPPMPPNSMHRDNTDKFGFSFAIVACKLLRISPDDYIVFMPIIFLNK